MATELHSRYISSFASNTNSFEHSVTEHLRMSGVYWGLTAMHVIGEEDKMAVSDITEWVLKCQHPCGGFGGNVGHDPHLLYTLSAVQILALNGALDRSRHLTDSFFSKVDSDNIASFVAGLQRADGSFSGDEWGEVDSRFSYCAVSCCSIINRLSSINVDKAVEFVVSCRNFDGGFGCVPGSETHAGQIFCCIGVLSIANALHHVDANLLGWWLSERQVDSGGLNGRPEKQADVCYSWWILSSMAMLGHLPWIDNDKLVKFILECQNLEEGGISDRPGNMSDVFHTFFGLAGLSLLGHFQSAGIKYRQIDPTYALPVEVVERLELNRQVLDTVTL